MDFDVCPAVLSKLLGRIVDEPQTTLARVLFEPLSQPDGFPLVSEPRMPSCGACRRPMYWVWLVSFPS